MKSSTTIFSRFALLICAGLVCVTGRFSESSDRTALFADPYIATSQNYFCAGQADPISLYCNVLAYDPSTNVDDWTFEWSPAGEVSDPNAQSVEITPNTTTVYSAVMTSPSGEVFVDDITIVVYAEFSVDAGSDMALCSTIGAGLSANASTSDPVTWLWEPAIGLNNPTLQNPQVLDEISQTYTVTATIAGLGGDGWGVGGGHFRRVFNYSFSCQILPGLNTVLFLLLGGSWTPVFFFFAQQKNSIELPIAY